MEINKPLRIKSIWLDSKTASINTNRTQLIFNKLPLIQVRGSRNVLKINSVSLASSNASNYTGHVWEFKIDRVLFNQNYYFNSDNNSIPTIANVMIDSNQMYNTNSGGLEIEQQDINQIVLYVKSSDDHGLTKNSQDIHLYLNLIIEEYF